MRFIVSSTALCSKLSTLSKVIASKNAMEILFDFIFEVEGNILNIKASDGENTMETQVELSESDVDGLIAIRNEDILEAIKGLSEQPLTFECNIEQRLCSIFYQNGLFTMPVDDVEEAPEIPVVGPDAKSFVIPANILLDNINRSLFAAAQDNLRLVMNGIYFGLSNEGLSIVASDGHELVRNIIMTIKSDEPSSFIMAKKPAALLKSILTEDGGDVTIRYDKQNAFIDYGDGTLTCRLIDGRYPNYSAVIPQYNANEAIVDRQTLLQAIRRVTPFAPVSSRLVKFHFDTGTLRLDAQDIDYSKAATERMVCQYTGTPMSIGFKGTSFTDVIAAIESTDVVIQLADPSRAGLIMPAEQPENQDILMLLMPMIIYDN